MLLNILLETLAECGNVGPAQGKSCGIGMASEVDEQITATLYGRIDVKAHHRAGRARRKVAVACQHHRRTKIDLCQSGSHNADDTFLPVLIIEHDA